MARSMRDGTNIYRFKTTHKGVYVTLEEYHSGIAGQYNSRLAGQSFEDVSLVGPYTSRIAWQGWVPRYGTFKVERQKLEAYLDNPQEGAKLEWQTIETKSYENGERSDS